MKNASKNQTSSAKELHPIGWSELSELWLQPWKDIFKAKQYCQLTSTEQYKVKIEPEIEPPSTFDRVVHANLAHLTMGVSPASLALAYADWATHLAVSPAKLVRLAEKSVRKTTRIANFLPQALFCPESATCIQPLPQDQRFKEDAWKQWPFNFYNQAFLLQQQWWHNATTGIEGVSPHSQNVVSFLARQMLDVVSPVNFALTNPVVLEATVKEAGLNLLRGFQNLVEDVERTSNGKPPIGIEQFQPGKQVAITPGKVVFRNKLIELIQYTPTTKKVNAEPILIVPAWIMKYYILDLSPKNSLVRYLVDQGHTVFMISWHNPNENDRNLGMDDYLNLGILAALTAIQTIVPEKKINAVGYCLGGTLLAIAAAYLSATTASKNNPILQSMTLLAAQTDFTEAGELTLFIDNSQISYLDDMMWDKGYLDTKQMAGAFQLLRSNDLIWSPLVQQYLLGTRPPMTDLMAWNADATRMPYRMHSEYLHRLFLNNDLFEGRFQIADEHNVNQHISLNNIQIPMFVVATEKDHVAPWRSVYKIKLAKNASTTFVLTSGGHNAGIVSEPGHANRYFRVDTKSSENIYIDPDQWLASIAQQNGSWWPVFSDWLTAQASGKVNPPKMGAAENGYPLLMDAPGEYVTEI
jgi:polyhydroxyalkanoate synthase